MSSLVEINGNMGEGGGQVVRIAVCLSALYNIPIRIINIRMRRHTPGLATQHLKGVKLLQSMCNAKVQGAHIGSMRLEFKPNRLKARKRHTFVVDTGTAGCISLLAQIALPCALFCSQTNIVTLILKGGTNVSLGPQIEYLTEVLRPLLKKFGADFDFRVLSRGYYPKGGGEVHLYIKPVQVLRAVNLFDPGLPSKINIWSYVTGVVPIEVAYRMAYHARTVLTRDLKQYNIPVPPINVEAYKEDNCPAASDGSGINIVCTTTSGCYFGGSGLSQSRREEIAPGGHAAKEISDTILADSSVDKYAQDQLMVFMALARGTSIITLGRQKLTCHAETAIKVIERMLSDYNFHFAMGGSSNCYDDVSYTLECEGCNYQNNIEK